MTKSLEDYGNDFESDPKRFIKRAFWTIVACLPLFMILGLGLRACGFMTGAADNAMTTAKKEFYPDALLRKYEWFKNAAAALDQKVATIEVYNKRLQSLADAYKGEARSKWPRDDREQFNLWRSELDGIRASYNELASDYNAQMSKFNWRFTNVGDLPPGASSPLPREFKPYVTE
jgi:hypothetical protein